MRVPRLLDLFCGAGGAARGYHSAGFKVIGVDVAPQPNYPFEFVQADAVEFLERMGAGGTWQWLGLGLFDAIHASPPCQGYSTQTADRSRHQRMIPEVRELLEATGKPYVIENVEGARRELVDPVRLCGSSFGLDLRRHRYFESNVGLVAPPCDHAWQTPRFRSLDQRQINAGRLASVVGVHGHINYPGEFPLRCAAMGIDWMTNDELVEAIPPAYTRHLGAQLLQHVLTGVGA